MGERPQKPEIRESMEKILKINGREIQFRLTIFSNGVFHVDNFGEEIQITGVISDTAAQFGHIFVTSDLREQGVGSAILASLEDELSKKNVTSLFAVFSVRDSQQVRFLLKKGFHITPKGRMSRDEAQSLDIPYDYIDDSVRSDGDIQKAIDCQKKSATFEAEIHLKKFLFKKDLLNSEK